MSRNPNKVCRKCKIEKPVAEFYKEERCRDGFAGTCKLCTEKRRREYRLTHKKEHAVRDRIYLDKPGVREKRRFDTLKRKYGITKERFDRLFKLQEGVCAICGGVNIPGLKHGVLAVDHDHKIGNVRGLLCDRCNRVLGFTQDSKGLLAKMIGYLDRHE